MTKKILIAEDDSDILFILNIMLKDAGYHVEMMTEGSGILHRKTNWPDLFILDKEMPVIDGLALCKYLKLQKETKDIPVIVMSCYYKLKEKARKAGADDFIEKPFDRKVLLSTIDKYIKSN